MIRLKVLMIAFPIYVYFHGRFFFFILMGLVLTICDPFLFFHYHLPFRTCVISYVQPWCDRIPPYRDLSIVPYRLLLSTFDTSLQISGIGLPFVLIMSKPMCIKALYFICHTKKRPAFGRIFSWL